MAALDTHDVQRFLDTASGSPYGPLFFLAIYTGMRRSELLGLRWKVVDIGARTLSVTETLQRYQARD